MTLDDIIRDLDYASYSLRTEIQQRRYESAAQTAEMIRQLAKAADRLAYSVPRVADLSLKDVYGV